MAEDIYKPAWSVSDMLGSGALVSVLVCSFQSRICVSVGVLSVRVSCVNAGAAARLPIGVGSMGRGH